MIYFYTFIVALVVAFIASPLMRYIAVKCDIMDHPNTAVKTHAKSTPYLGGVAIWLGFTGALLAVRFLTNFESGTLRSLRGIFIAGFIMLVVGLFDDIFDMNFKKKFFWQIVAAIVLVFFNIKINFIQPDYLGIGCTILWVVAITNAFNLIDIMDGLSSGVAFIASLSFLLINAPTEHIYVNFAAAALAGACLGFLPYNKPPQAKMFMGDTGSMFIGIVLAGISLGTNYSVINNISVFTPIIILGVAIYDTMYIIYKRIEQKRPIFLGSKDHFALRLGKMGWSKEKILIITYSVAAICGLVSYFITRVNLEYAVMIYMGVLVSGILISAFLGRVKME
jgi:UDP-GlcNAc:undecaprenyl-phosphate/decaprenyl-phosphate GlcNAc-1-phosphate transferase